MNLSKTGVSVASTALTETANAVDIYIPAGKGGVLKSVEVIVNGILETVVDTCARITLRNSSADWTPFRFFTGYQTTVTAGGDYMEPTRISCEKELPGNSHVYADVMLYDNQSSTVQITLIWEKGATLGLETFSNAIFPLKTAAVTSVARALTDTIPIPGGKGGTSYAIGLLALPTVTTVVNSGGMAELVLDAYDNTPSEFYTPIDTTVGAAGGSYGRVYVMPYVQDLPGNSNMAVYYTPRTTESQTLAAVLFWRRTPEK